MKTKILLFAALASCAALTTVFGMREALNATASVAVNEYGCAGNCTAEYQIDHVYRLFENKPSGYLVDGVRFKVRFAVDCAQNRWFQDVGDPNAYVNSKAVKAGLGSLLMVNGREQGLTRFKAGDEVSFFATVSKAKDPWGVAKVLYAENPVYYRVNGNEDLSLLETPTYIPEE